MTVKVDYEYLLSTLSVHILGRWWIVGSVWTGQSRPSSTLTTPTTDDWVMSVARKQQMNTDVRKTIFGVLMTSEVSNETCLML